MVSMCLRASARIANIRLAAMMMCFVLAPAWAVDLTRQVHFSIGPQRLSTALLEFSHQAKVQIIVGPEVGDRKTSGVAGTHSIADGLATLLGGSPLEYRVVNDTSITIGIAAVRDNVDAGKTSAAPVIENKDDFAKSERRLARVDQGQASNVTAAESNDEE